MQQSATAFGNVLRNSHGVPPTCCANGKVLVISGWLSMNSEHPDRTGPLRAPGGYFRFGVMAP
jgi:hypothetical protein